MKKINIIDNNVPNIAKLTTRSTRVANRIIRNINNNKRVQTVYGNWFSALMEWDEQWGFVRYLIEQGLNVLCYRPEDSVYGYECEQGKVFYCNEARILGESRDAYDVIFIEAPVAGFDKQFIDDNTEFAKYPGLHRFISEAINNPNVFIVCFEKYERELRRTQIVPIIATEQMLTKENFDAIYPGYRASIQKELRKLTRHELLLENRKFTPKRRTQGIVRSVGVSGGSQSVLSELEELRKERDFLRDLVLKRIKPLGVSDILEEQDIEKFDLYFASQHEELEKEVIEELTKEVWDKMCNESRRLWLTARTYMSDYATLEFSSVCMLTSKVLEIELGRRFVTGYSLYLKDKGYKGNNLPSGLLHKKQGKNRPLSFGDFTLGNCPYIMGLVGANKNQKEINQELFVKYCSEQLLPQMDEIEIKRWIRKYDSHIRHVKEKYRNPAVHKGLVTYADARECINYLGNSQEGVGENIFIKMMTDFSC